MDIKRITAYLASKKTLIIALAAITGVTLTLISYIPGKKDTASQKNRLDSYIEETESRLADTLSKISGAGKTEVFITVSDTFETVYASNASIDEDERRKTTEKQLAYASSSSYGQNPVVIKELYPDIKGVLIVCEGGNNPNIKTEIINSASIALGISKSKIYVTGGTD